MSKHETRGGKRPGAGRPLKYGEETRIVQVSIPISRKPELKEWLRQKRREWAAKAKDKGA
jgi:hypothetical protein